MKNFLNGTYKKYSIIFKILNYYSKDYRKYIFALFVLSLVIGLFETLQIVLLYPILTESLHLADDNLTFFQPLYNFVRTTMDLPGIVSFCLIFILLVFIGFITTLIYYRISFGFSKAMIVKTKRRIFDKLMGNDYKYYVDNKHGDILYDVVAAPNNIRVFLETATRYFADLVVILSILALLVFVSLFGVTLLVIGGLLYFLILKYVGKKVSYYLGKLQILTSQSENKVITEYIHGIRQIRSVYGDNHWKEKYDEALSKYWDKFVKYRFFEQVPMASLNLLFFISIAALVIIFYYMYQDSFLYILPVFGTFAYSALKILPKLLSSGSNNAALLNSWPNLERIYRFLNDETYQSIQNGDKKFLHLDSDISFENVSFRYFKNQELIEGVNLVIKQNRMTALVGHSGSGKSTIVSLLLRLYDVESGEITINGIDLREYDLESYLEKVGYVSQNTFVYNASVRENIAFGGIFSDEKIVEAAIKANAHDFIVNLPEGYDTIVGDQGLRLSGGEKQRIAIARALVRDPEILLLDEATSSLDNESESIVQSSINKVSKNVTTFVVAHRLSTIRNADNIYVMSKGKIVENGKHDELIEKRGMYYELYKHGG